MSAESASQDSPENRGPSPPAGGQKPIVKERLLSLDTFRGLFVLLLGDLEQLANLGDLPVFARLHVRSAQLHNDLINWV